MFLHYAPLSVLTAPIYPNLSNITLLPLLPLNTLHFLQNKNMAEYTEKDNHNVEQKTKPKSLEVEQKVSVSRIPVVNSFPNLNLVFFPF